MSRRRSSKRSQKAEPRRRKGGRLRKAAVVLSVAVLLTFLAAGLLLSGLIGGGPSGPRTAGIVDQLSLTQPNPSFGQEATSLLEGAGYAVDYYPGEQVTVDFYRNLPTHDYDLIILRVHSGRVVEVDRATGAETLTDYVSLFTSEPYSQAKYLDEQKGSGGVPAPLGPSTYYEGGAQYFGITPQFVRSSMRDRFDKTLIIMMGCDGLRSQRTGQAFLDEGASAFVSWTEPVSASHTDAATLRLLQLLLVQGLTPEEAVSQTAAELGPDPVYGAELRILTDGG